MSHAQINAKWPRALAICDRCNMRYNHDQLQWQHQWVGVKLQNIRLLVCPSCLDKPQEQLRTITLPPDPVPIQDPRPENYLVANNPLSAIGANPDPHLWEFSTRIGNLVECGGVQAAFDGVNHKDVNSCAQLQRVSSSGFEHWVGINWGGSNDGITNPSSLATPAITHTLKSFSIYSPYTRGFIGSTTATNYLVQGSSDAVTWTTLASGVTNGVAQDVVTGTVSNTAPYQYHRVDIEADLNQPVRISQVKFYVGEVGSAT